MCRLHSFQLFQGTSSGLLHHNLRLNQWVCQNWLRGCKMVATNKGFNSHPVLQLFLVTNFWNCSTINPSCSALAAATLFHMTGCECHSLHELSSSRLPSSGSWKALRSTFLLFCEERFPSSCKPYRRLLGNFNECQPSKALFTFLLVFSTACNWLVLSSALLLYS